MSLNLAIIGGGASGLAAAIEAKRESKKAGLQLNVTVFEHLNKPAKKILATGNGRCNFSNTDLSNSHYFGDNDLINNVLSSKYNDSIGFFKSIIYLIKLHCLITNRIYIGSICNFIKCF